MRNTLRCGNEHCRDGVLAWVTSGIRVDVEQLNELNLERGFFERFPDCGIFD
jgi:hypothetical protein